MGVTKQLLNFGGKPLVRRMAETALASNCSHVIVVIGARCDRVRDALEGLPLQFVENPAWEQGIGSSLRAGIVAAGEAGVNAALVMLADQPFVTTAILNQLIHSYQSTGLPVVACRYAGTVGVPALFAKELFSHLAAVPVDQGCKALLLAHREHARFLDCPEAAADLDTPADYIDALTQLSVLATEYRRSPSGHPLPTDQGFGPFPPPPEWQN